MTNGNEESQITLTHVHDINDLMRLSARQPVDSPKDDAMG